MALALAAVTAVCAGTLASVQPAFAASTTATYSAGTSALSAVFAPASTSYSESTGMRSLSVAGTGGSEAVIVTVPPTGTFTITVVPGTVTMQRTRGRLVATGMLQDVTVTDTRNYAPGWSVSGQESLFTASGTRATFPGDDLGWVPVAVSPLVRGASLGPAVAPGTRRHGLGTGSVLAYADAGSGIGTNTLSASLTLDIPNSALANLYTGSLTITYLETGPQPGASRVGV
jgi:hypothetical protein